MGMCGGIAAALSLGVAKQKQTSVWPYLLAYNIARLMSYMLAGMFVGSVSWLGGQLIEVNQFQIGLQFVAGIFMIALGLYVAGWWFGLAKVEQAGGMIWRRLEPIGRRCLPVKTLSQAFILGLVWGWLPCGLVYSVLFWAIASGSPVEGGLLMLSFGLGTLPNLLLMGLFASKLNQFVKHLWVRYLAGMFIILLGLYSLLQAVILLND